MTATREETLAVLRKGLERVKHGWTQGTCARDADGRICNCRSDAAASWCAYGATETDFDAGCALDDTLEAQGWDKGHVNYNDMRGRTQAEIVTLFERTIARLEAAP
jgi:hypothetical protein